MEMSLCWMLIFSLLIVKINAKCQVKKFKTVRASCNKMLLLCALVGLLISAISCPLVNGRSDTGLNLEELTEAAYPEIFNAAKGSIITTNATCGQSGPETYCHYRPDGGKSECGVCDSANLNPDQRHPITNAIDNTSSWWQSPSLQSGRRFEYVTITIDLKQEFHIHYVRIKAASSPLPGNWILERSIDGTSYKPWQYFVNSYSDCWQNYGTSPFIEQVGDHVICTADHAEQLQNGEINVNLSKGQPGAELLSSFRGEFIKARYIRMRFQKFSIPAEDRKTLEYLTVSNQTTANQLYYTLREIEIGAQCICNGHAKNCSIDRVTQLRECECLHNTCGDSCIECCSLFNQRPLKSATKHQAAVCEACECYGHSDRCVYDAGVASRNASINALGERQGGGVCVDCKHHTAGNNCDQCMDGYFRPKEMPKNATNPCHECQCRGSRTTGFCIKDDSQALEGLAPGDCICKQGFQGKNCESCAPGYIHYPRCDPCNCKNEGVINPDTCDGPCICKKKVEGPRCDRCKPGFYNLAADNPDGCSPCFCFGATSSCESSGWGIEIVSSPITYLPGWRVSDLNGQRVIDPELEDDHLVIADDDVSGTKPYYWQAPREYLGEKLYSYGGDLRFLISFTILRGDVMGFYTEEPDVIVEGGTKNLRIGHYRKKYDLDNNFKMLITLPLREQEWFTLDSDGQKIRPATREEFTLVIHDLKRLLILAKSHHDQVKGSLYQVEMEKASNDSKSLQKQIGAEACNCLEGYAGLSCELCAPGYRRVDNVLVGGQCVKCDCNNHADSCYPYTGICTKCLHNTKGSNCSQCEYRFYGIVTGKIDDCKPCPCPHTIPQTDFSPTCHTTPDGDYECDFCRYPFTGKKCERCEDSFYGDPTVPDGKCFRCGCHPKGSENETCDEATGQCKCRPYVIGRDCGQCAPGTWNIDSGRGCEDCNCDPIGSISPECDITTGQCKCKHGVSDLKYDQCKLGNYGLSTTGCLRSQRGCQLNDTLINYPKSILKKDQYKSITSVDKNYYRALITESGNLTIDYISIIHKRCDGLYNFVAAKPKNSVGVIFEFLPLSKDFANQYGIISTCDSKKCHLVYHNNKALPPLFTVDIAANLSDCPGEELSPKKLNLHTEMKFLQLDHLLRGGFRMLIFVPTEKKISAIQSDGGELITFGNFEDLSSCPSVTIGTAKLTDISQADEPNYTIPIKASNPKEVSVDPRSTNLPIACFFGGKTSGGKVYEVLIEFETASNNTIPSDHTYSLAWTVSISLGNPSNHLSKSAASASQVSGIFLFIIFLLLIFKAISK